MADNASLTLGDGSLVAAADDIGGVKYPRVKVNFGADGSTVDVSSTDPLPVAVAAPGATNIAKAEDSASANADVGVPAMAIQKATPADTAGTDGDYAMLQMSAGRLWVDASGTTLTVGSHAVTNAGTFATQAAQSGTWTVQPGNTANTTAWKVDGSAVTQPVSGAISFTAPQHIIADSGTITTVSTVSTVTNVVHVDDNSGSLTVDGTVAVSGNVSVIGPTAADAALTVAPITFGGRATNTNLAEMSADGDVVNATFTMQGALVTAHAPRELFAVQQTSVSNSTSETLVVTAGGSGIFQDLYGLVLANTGSTTTKVTVKDATGGTTRMIFEVPTLETRGFMVPAASAVPQSSSNGNWTVTCASATTALEVTALTVKRK